MNNNNTYISKLMQMLSKMDKKDLQASMNQLSSILNSNDKAKIINQLKNTLNNK